MQVSKSGFYKWLLTKDAKNTKLSQLEEAVIKTHASSKGRYGKRRVFAIIKNTFPNVGKKKVAKIMFKFNLFGIGKAKFKKTTEVSKKARHCPDLVVGHFECSKQDELWTSDISYVWTKEGWLYLSVILDAFSRHIIGWSLQENMKKEIVLNSLNAAFKKRCGFKKGIIFHSDKGTQYSSNEVKYYLLANGFYQSMSNSCYDNSITETFFATIKKELIYQCSFLTKQEAKCAIVEFIETYYNRVRIHSSLGYLSPMQYELKYGT